MEFTDYDIGWRHGTFDKCNGVQATFGPDETDPWTCGYFDAYNSNENRIIVETEDEKIDRLVDEAFAAGQEFADEIRPDFDARANIHGDFSDSFWDGFIDRL